MASTSRAGSASRVAIVSGRVVISRLELGVAVVFVGATVHGRAGDNSMGASESTALDVGKDAVFIPWKDGQSSAVAPQPTKKPAKQPALGGLVLDEKARSKVRSILDEVIATERTYVTALGTLNEKFLPLIRTELDGECLACLGTLLSIHRELLTSLEDALSQRERLEEAAAEEAESAPPEQPSMLVEMHLWSVARAFTMMAPFLKTYSTYCRGYTRAIAQLPAVFRAVPQLATLQAENGNEGSTRCSSARCRPANTRYSSARSRAPSAAAAAAAAATCCGRSWRR